MLIPFSVVPHSTNSVHLVRPKLWSLSLQWDFFPIFEVYLSELLGMYTEEDHQDE